MQFEYEIKREDYSDLSSGRVLLLTQKTAFPVRMASEIMYRCRSYIEKKDHLSIYDPCCGGAHMLTVTGFLHGESISKIHGSDIDESVIRTAKGNLSMLTSEGLQ